MNKHAKGYRQLNGETVGFWERVASSFGAWTMALLLVSLFLFPVGMVFFLPVMAFGIIRELIQ